jgi:hypothetical protein
VEKKEKKNLGSWREMIRKILCSMAALPCFKRPGIHSSPKTTVLPDCGALTFVREEGEKRSDTFPNSD